MLSTDFSILTMGLYIASLVAFIVSLAIVVPRLRRVRRAVRDDSVPADAMVEFPPVSVIVHAQGEATSLRTLLPMIMAQDYPAQFEVIVVNDGGDDAVSDVVARLEHEYRDLYMTFAPARSRNLSRRKLSITLGVKAARYDCVMILSGNSRLVSENWMRLMMRHIALGRQIVVGYGYVIDGENSDCRRHRMVAFDAVRDAVQYLGSALHGRLYRAFGSNIAYRRQLFFDNKGFSGSLNLRYGDDDIFVSAIATRSNFAVELSPDAMVEIVEDTPARYHRLQKLRHDFTARFVSCRQRLLWGLASLMWWAWTLCSAASIVLGLPSLIPAAAVVGVAIPGMLWLMFSWKGCSVALHNRRLFLTVPWFMWIHPFYSLAYRIAGRRKRNDNYTWSASV